MGEFPLELRRKQLMVNYWAGLQGHNNSHPTKVMLQDSLEYGKRLSENFGRIGNYTAKELGVFNLRISFSVVYPETAPWKLVWPEVDWFVLEEKRRAKEGINLKIVFNNRVVEKYKDYIATGLYGWCQETRDGSNRIACGGSEQRNWN